MSFVEKIQALAPLILFVMVILATNCGSSQTDKQQTVPISPANIRKAAVAGQFYPADPAKLKDLMLTFFNNVAQDIQYPDIIGLISPHAGLVYSGQTAAYAYKQVAGNQYDAVVIVAPSHYERIQGASIWSKGAYQTPLGLVPIHETLARAIIDNEKAIQASSAGHGKEHSLEVQLPFLQLTLKNLKIVPIVMQDYSFDNCQRVANAIARACQGKKILLVASTDLYHGKSYDDCVLSSNKTLEAIEKFKPKALFESFHSGQSQACGAGPVLVVEMAARQLNATHAKLLHQTNSNDVVGQRGGYVVGYGAVVIYKNDKEKQTKKRVGVYMGLTLDEKRQLIHIARQSIEHAVHNKPLPEFKITSPVLKEKRGAFVTLNKNKRLRGCIGYVVAYKPLYQTVSEMARAAALQDPRFPAVKPVELEQLQVDISVLTPVREITDVTEIEIGKHGIIIERGGNSGLLLPQVATDNEWDRNTFLEHTCRKAGLPLKAWKKSGTTIKIFSADVFSEEDVL